MEIIWEVDDGYVGHGPHTLEIDDEELKEAVEDGMTEDDFIEERVKEAFEQTVHYFWKRG